MITALILTSPLIKPTLLRHIELASHNGFYRWGLLSHLQKLLNPEHVSMVSNSQRYLIILSSTCKEFFRWMQLHPELNIEYGREGEQRAYRRFSGFKTLEP